MKTQSSSNCSWNRENPTHKVLGYNAYIFRLHITRLLFDYSQENHDLLFTVFNCTRSWKKIYKEIDIDFARLIDNSDPLCHSQFLFWKFLKATKKYVSGRWFRCKNIFPMTSLLFFNFNDIYFYSTKHLDSTINFKEVIMSYLSSDYASS